MKSNQSCLVAITVALSSLLAPVPAKGAPDSSFAVSVIPEKPIYLLGEPVAIVLGVTWLGSDAIDVPNPLDHMNYREELQSTSSAGSEYLRLWTHEEALSELKFRPKPRASLHFEPNSTVMRTNWYVCWPQVAVIITNSGLVFSNAGEYSIRARVQWQGKTFDASSRLTVQLPSLAADLEAYDWMKKNNSFCALGDLLETIRIPNEYGNRVRGFDELRAKRPDSTYAVFIDRTYMMASNSMGSAQTRFPQSLGERPIPVKPLK